MSPATAPMRTPERVSRRKVGARRWYTTMASTAPPTTQRQQPQDKTETALRSPAGTATRSAARMASLQEIPWARATLPGGRSLAYPLSPSSCWANLSCGEPQLGQNSSGALSVAPHRWQVGFIPLEAISGASGAQSVASAGDICPRSVGALLLIVEAMGKIQRDQAEVGRRGAAAM